jgi:hypothetical protein
MKRNVALSIVLGVCMIVFLANGQGPKRNRGEGMYQTLGSNTTGTDNIWLNLRGTGFIWANKSLDSTNQNASEKPGYFPFLDIASEIGATNYASILFESRLLSYTRDNWFQFGNVAAGIKATMPNNKELRLYGLGLELKYIWNYPGDTFPSVAGYRVGTTGFAPEGYIVDGSNLQCKILYDLDLIKRFSWLPVKIGANAGMRIPFKKAEYAATQFLFDVGILYTDLGFDIFAEYSLEAFNNITKPKAFVNLGHPKMEIYFWENPMYLTLGGRVRYANGVTLFASIPILLSANGGSAMTSVDKRLLNDARAPGDKFYDERSRNITDPFDPWFAKWKIVGQVSIPLFYKQTGSEMMRNFLLLKNRKERQQIDVEERLRHFDVKTDTLKTDRSEKKRRLEEIQKRREEMDNSD